MDTKNSPLAAWGALVWLSTVCWCSKNLFIFFYPFFKPIKISLKFTFTHALIGKTKKLQPYRKRRTSLMTCIADLATNEPIIFVILKFKSFTCNGHFTCFFNCFFLLPRRFFLQTEIIDKCEPFHLFYKHVRAFIVIIFFPFSSRCALDQSAARRLR